MAPMIAEALVPVFFVMFLGYFAGARRIIDNHHVASLNVLLMTFAVIAYAIALAIGMSGEIAREVILLTAIPSGFFGILFGLNYGVRSQTIGLYTYP